MRDEILEACVGRGEPGSGELLRGSLGLESFERRTRSKAVGGRELIVAQI